MAILAIIIVSLLSLVGVVWSKPSIKLVAMAAGSLIFGALMHLWPEAREELGLRSGMGVAVGVVIFWGLEKILLWRHCHEGGDCQKHHFGMMNLAGDGLHNLIDGIVIGGAFSVSKETGILTSIMVVLHEIPQEIGDFGVLIYSGWARKKALMLNLAIGMMAVAGAVIGTKIEPNWLPWLMAITAGGFLYIGGVDLVPEIIKKKESWMWFGLGAGLMVAGKLVE